MKRDIKFRGQRHDGSWVYGCLVYSEDICTAIYFQTGTGKVKTMDFIYVKAESVGEFTGLKDKNGKDIYEGDIVSDHLGNISEIKFGHPYLQGFYLRCHIDRNGQMIDITDSGEIGWYTMSSNSKEELEVIGNIHQYSHLIK